MGQSYFMVTSADWYFGLLCVNGKYRCLIMCYKENSFKIQLRLPNADETHPNLSLHCYTEKRDEVHHEYGPEDRNIEDVEEGTAKCNRGGLGDRVPELKLGKSPDERSEFFVASRWEGWTVGVVC